MTDHARDDVVKNKKNLRKKKNKREGYIYSSCTENVAEHGSMILFVYDGSIEEETTIYVYTEKEKQQIVCG